MEFVHYSITLKLKTIIIQEGSCTNTDFDNLSVRNL